ncbi:MAG: DNA polymerase III subunit delta [Bacteroidales bacterium]|nr:DNA polymerase III subunit delta [Bacteroidales bacterium]
MAKTSVDTGALARKLEEDARSGIFQPVYLLMGEEPYYPDRVCQAVMAHALQDFERDFNETVFYGPDTDAMTVSSECRSYPMMAERRLVVLKEAQNMRSLEDLAAYCAEPMESTVLVILLHGANADKRRALYKTVQKTGVVLESPALRDYEIDRWITAYYQGRGLSIAPDAAALLGEYAGTDLCRIAVETDKLLKNLPEGTTQVTSEDIEKNVGISRQYSIFELTRELSLRNRPKALRIASRVAADPKFALPMAVSALYTHFYRILKYEALLAANPHPSPTDKAAVLSVNPYFYREYDTAVGNYPLRRCMAIVAMLEEYDYKGKGGDSSEATPAGLLLELVSKILN